MNIGSWDSDSISMLFSSVGSTKSSSSSLSSLTSLLSDYSSIKSGAYGKLIKAYCASQSEDSSSSTTTKTKTSTSTAEDSTQTLSSIQTATDALYETSEKLRKEAASADSMDELYATVSQFVSDYNKTIDAAEDSNTDTIKSNLDDMKLATSTNKNLLSSIGITIGDDNKLVLDEETFKAGSLSTAKTLFTGAGSYAYNVSLEASMMNSSADYQASKANTYNTTGSFSNNYTTGDLFDSLF